MAPDLSKNLQALYELEAQSDVKLLTNDARLLHIIKSDPGRSIKYYLSKSGLSYRGFYNVFNKLLSEQMVVIVNSENDHRSKCVY